MQNRRIALDAMGSDMHPVAEIRGAVEAAKRLGIRVLLVGDQETLAREMLRLGGHPAIDIRHAPQAVSMADRPTTALRHKPLSSMRIALEAVRSGEADALVSAGNSGALLFGAVTTLGKIEGVERPAIAAELPTLGRPVLLADAGANSDCRPAHLLGFARLAEAAVRASGGSSHPAVAVISNGEETSKGTELTRGAIELLRASDLNFVGAIEPNELSRGAIDVAVTDGFSGNLILKTMEGTAHLTWALLRRAFHHGLFPEMGYWMARRSMRRHLGTTLDYQERGGAPLLGVNGIVIVAHGRSGPRAIASALKQATELSGLRLTAALRHGLTTPVLATA